MASREPRSDGGSLANLASDFRRVLREFQELAEEFTARAHGAELAADSVAAPQPRDRQGVVEIFCLGPFSLRFEGRSIELPTSGRPAAILKVLADRGGRPLSRDQLVELLWPGVPADAGANRLRVAVHALRQALGDGVDLVAFEQGAYRLSADHIELDAERFESLVSEGRTLAELGEPEAARRRYEEAERLYRGDYFEDDPFEEWATVRRQHLRDLYLNLLVKLALLAMERADYDACVGYGHAIVREDVSSEDAYRLLMLAHARLGSRARALRWYELCAQALSRELDLVPSVATERLRDEILSEDGAGGRSVRERLGLGAVGGLLAALGGAVASQKAAVAIVVATFAFMSGAGGNASGRPGVSIRSAEAAELGAPELSAAPLPARLDGPLGTSAGEPRPPGSPPHSRPNGSRLDDTEPLDVIRGPAGAEDPAPPNAPSLQAVGQPSAVPAPASASSSGAPPASAGPPPSAGPKEGQGSAPEHAGPPDHAGPKTEVGGGPPAWAGPPANAGPKDSHGNAPEGAGPPEHAGPKHEAGGGPPAWAGSSATAGAETLQATLTSATGDDVSTPGPPEQAGPKDGRGNPPDHAGPNAPASPPGQALGGS